VLFGPFYFLLGLVLMTFVGLPIGALIGWASGRLTRKAVRWCHNGPIFNLLDLPIGFAGLVAGLAAAFVGFTVNEQWQNGQLVYRRTTGFGDYAVPIALVSAAIVTAIWNVVVGLGTILCTRLVWPFKPWSVIQSRSELLTSDTKWAISHGVLRTVIIVNTGLIAFELVQPRGHVHASMNVLSYVALWLSICAPSLLIYAGIEHWWMVKSGATAQRRAVMLDALGALGWMVAFLVSVPRIWSA
jgi:hypothetical protein